MSTQEQSVFFRIPAETRIQIYQEVFSSSAVTLQRTPHALAERFDFDGLLYSCKRIRGESELVRREVIKWTLDATSLRGGSRIPPVSVMQDVRYLKVQYPSVDQSTVKATSELIRLLGDSAPLARLTIEMSDDAWDGVRETGQEDSPCSGAVDVWPQFKSFATARRLPLWFERVESCRTW